MSTNRMAPPPGRPFSDAEKLKLLSDIVKASGLPPHHLLRLIHENDVQPQWNDIPLPEGRTVNQCQWAFQEMLSSYRSSQGHGQALSPHYMEPRYDPYSSAGQSSAGAHQPPQYPSSSQALPPMRTLQPRPTSYHAPPPLDPTVQPYTPTISEPPAKRRGRGRPSKEQIEAERRAAEARGEEYPPPKTSRKRTNPELPSPLPPTFPPAGSSTSSVGPESSGQGPYISPVREYTLSGGGGQGPSPRDARDPNRWAETIGYTAPNVPTVRPPMPGPSSEPYRGPPSQPPPSHYASSPRIGAPQHQRTHSRSPAPHHRPGGGGQ